MQSHTNALWRFSMEIVPSNTAHGSSIPEHKSFIERIKHVFSKNNGKDGCMRLMAAQRTDVGLKRQHNEDTVAYIIPKDWEVLARKGALFVVADGMGGHAAGEVASEMAVSTVTTLYYQDDGDAPECLLRSIKYANAIIFQKAMENIEHNGMGTTCVAAVLLGEVAYIANVGDSRAYLVRKGQVRQISQDHSWVAEQVRVGAMSEVDARQHEMRNMITRSLGSLPEVDVDIFAEMVREDDTLVLCSDGLSGMISDTEILMIVEQYSPQECVYRLIERANAYGGNDNITALVVHISFARGS
jgi:serine/threonine protein phosphatase PrpC